MSPCLPTEALRKHGPVGAAVPGPELRTPWASSGKTSSLRRLDIRHLISTSFGSREQADHRHSAAPDVEAPSAPRTDVRSPPLGFSL